MTYLGDFAAGASVHFLWSTNGADGASITRSTDGSIRIYKDASATQRSSSAGITDTEDFDSLTGVHLCAIDLSDNTDSGFYAAGHNYTVVLQGATIDTKTVNSVLAHFSIANRNTAVSLSSAERNSLADAILQRASSSWEASAPAKSLGAAVMKLTHKVASAGGTLTTYRSDGTTPHCTQSETTDAAADPLIGLGGAA